MTRSKKGFIALVVVAVVLVLSMTLIALAATTPGYVVVDGGKGQYTTTVSVGSSQLATFAVVSNSAAQPLVISAYNGNTYIGNTIGVYGPASAKYYVYNDGTVTTVVNYNIVV